MKQQAKDNRSDAEIFGFALCALLLTVGDYAQAQQLSKLPRIGYIASAGPDAAGTNRGAFQQELRELGIRKEKTSSSSFAI